MILKQFIFGDKSKREAEAKIHTGMNVFYISTDNRDRIYKNHSFTMLFSLLLPILKWPIVLTFIIIKWEAEAKIHTGMNVFYISTDNRDRIYKNHSFTMLFSLLLPILKWWIVLTFIFAIWTIVWDWLGYNAINPLDAIFIKIQIYDWIVKC